MTNLPMELVPMESNGAKAARAAAAHVTDLERQIERLRSDYDLMRTQLSNLQSSYDTLEAEFQLTKREKDYYMIQAMGMKQALTGAASVLVDAVKQIELSPFKPREKTDERLANLSG